MMHDDERTNMFTRRQFLASAVVLAASVGPLRAATRPSPTTISVDLHSHAFLNDSEVDGFASSIGPDVSFLSGHHKMGSMPSLFKAVKENKILIARNPADILRAKSEGRRVAILAHEGGYLLNGDLSELEKLNAMGLISLQLVRTDSTNIVSSNGALTAFGKDVIRTQNRLGMIVDLAHCSAATIKQAAKVSTKPIMLSHINKPAKKAWKDVAESGGVIGNWWSPHDVRDGMTFKNWIGEFSRMVDTVGIDAVGVQTELGTKKHRGPFDSYTDWDKISQALLENGFSQEDADKILGGNFMRMFSIITAT